VAVDALAPVVHPENPVKELSIEQLRDIYGGKNDSIAVISRSYDNQLHLIPPRLWLAGERCCMKKIALFLLAFPLLASCTPESGTAAFSENELLSRSYTLQSVNGVLFASDERTPEIEFDASMRVGGHICNKFMGQGQLKKNVLKVPELASTMMLCADSRLNSMEHDFTAMLRQGAKLGLEGDTLTLTRGGITYTFHRQQ